MKLIEKHIIRKNHKLFKECDDLCFKSKNLYNKANYIIRKEFINNKKYLNFYDINRLMIDSNDEDYRQLPAKVSNGILRSLNKNWISFFKSIKDWSKNKEKYKGKPKLPKYKKKLSGRNVALYEKKAISKKELDKNSLIHFSKTNIYIKTKIKYDILQAARIVPKLNNYVIEIIYNKEEEDYGLNKNNILSIDLGLNNLASVADTKGNKFIINGKQLKSINQYYNKKKAYFQSKLNKNIFHSLRIDQLTNKRNNKINDYLHKASRYIINYCLTNNIGKIIIGKNKEWKHKINLSKRTNQNFVSIPFNKFIDMIKYKSKLCFIDVILTEESYTSKASFIDNDEMKKGYDFKGKRIKRGLFRTLNNIIINADINGALNIIKKVVPEFNINKLENGIEGIAVYPLKINFS